MELNNEKMLRAKLSAAVKEAKKANDELYSLGDMNLFNLDGALAVMSKEEFMKNTSEVKSFHEKVSKMLSEVKVVLPKNFDLATFRKEYNKVGQVMSWASSNFNYDNPILEFVGEEE